MRKPIHITTPWPTSEEVAKRFRISKRRQKELNAIAEEGVRLILKERGERAQKTAVKREAKSKHAPAAD
jgi:hypothetical protein